MTELINQKFCSAKIRCKAEVRRKLYVYDGRMPSDDAEARKTKQVERQRRQKKNDAACDFVSYSSIKSQSSSSTMMTTTTSSPQSAMLDSVFLCSLLVLFHLCLFDGVRAFILFISRCFFFFQTKTHTNTIYSLLRWKSIQEWCGKKTSIKCRRKGINSISLFGACSIVSSVWWWW